MSNLMLLSILAVFLQFALCLPSTITQISANDRTTTEYSAITTQLNTTTQNPVQSAIITQGHEKLSALIRDETNKHLKFLLKETHRLAKDLLADPTINNIDTEDMRKGKSLLEEYIKDSDNVYNSSFTKRRERVLKDFFTFSNRCSPKNVNRTNEEQTLWKALQAHGYEQFKSEENKLLNEIGNRYADEFENYLKSLSPADKEQEKDLMYVYETYMENQNIMDRSSYGYRLRNYFQNSDVMKLS